MREPENAPKLVQPPRSEVRRGAVLLLAAVALTSLPAAASPLAGALARQVARGHRLTAGLGVDVVDVASGASVYAYRAEVPRILASNTKLLTAATALDRLGPGYFFETRLYLRGEIGLGGVLRGDLGVVGGGDPEISGREWGGDPYGPFRPWAAALRRQGIRRVAGDLYLDHGFFADRERHPDWNPEDDEKWYQVPVAALGFNENVLHVRTLPPAAGETARVELVPELSSFALAGRLGKSDAAAAHRLVVDRTLDGRGVQVSGDGFRKAGSLDGYLAVADPVAYFGAALRAALVEEGIRIDGRIRSVERLPGLVWEEVAVQRTGLLEVVEVALKESQNFFAECLLKTVAARACGRGSWENGVKAVSELLEAAGVPPGSYRLADGSGLSRNDRLSPRQVTQLLRHAYLQRWGRELFDALPYGGEPGTTLEDRLAAPAYAERVHAKTGTLRGVSALSGYARGRSGRLYAFSILANGRGAYASRRLQDAIVRALVDHG